MRERKRKRDAQHGALGACSQAGYATYMEAFKYYYLLHIAYYVMHEIPRRAPLGRYHAVLFRSLGEAGLIFLMYEICNVHLSSYKRPQSSLRCRRHCPSDERSELRPALFYVLYMYANI